MLSLKELFKKYDIDKQGLATTYKKKCLCGEIMDIKVKSCPKCGTSLPASKLMKVNKPKVRGTRSESAFDGTNFEFKLWELTNEGLNVFEVATFVCTINFDGKNTEMFLSSNRLSIDNCREFYAALNEALPGFDAFLANYRHEYNIPIESKQFKDALCIYYYFRAFSKYLSAYNRNIIDLLWEIKNTFPDIDYNNDESVEKLPFKVNLLQAADKVQLWDLITFSKSLTKEEQRVFDNMLDSHRESWDEYKYTSNTINKINALSDAFSLVIRNVIPVSELIRLYLCSGIEGIYLLPELMQRHRRLYGEEIDWRKIKRIDEKLISTYTIKNRLNQDKRIPATVIDQVYHTLKSNPTEALNKLIAAQN